MLPCERPRKKRSFLDSGVLRLVRRRKTPSGKRGRWLGSSGASSAKSASAEPRSGETAIGKLAPILILKSRVLIVL